MYQNKIYILYPVLTNVLLIQTSILLQGEYRFVFNTMQPCEIMQDLQIKTNLYLSKKTRNITEIKGNLTFQTPFDDSVSVSLLKLIVNSQDVQRYNIKNTMLKQ